MRFRLPAGAFAAGAILDRLEGCRRWWAPAIKKGYVFTNWLDRDRSVLRGQDRGNKNRGGIAGLATMVQPRFKASGIRVAADTEGGWPLRNGSGHCHSGSDATWLVARHKP
jgi:hypothetical protein